MAQDYISSVTLPDNNSYDIRDSGAARGNARVFYGVCEDAGAAKTVNCSTYDSLQDGDVLFVNFTNVNTGAVANLTLNVNNKGARSIKYLNNASDPADIPAIGYIRAATYMFRYKAGTTASTSYWIIDIQYNSNTWTALSTTDAGYVAKAPNDTTKFLRGDVSWATLPSASTSTAGIIKIGIDATNAMAGNTVVNTVRQNKNTDNKEFPILLKTTDNKESETGEVKFVQNEDVTVNPANGRVSAPSFMVDAHVSLQYNATDQSLDFIFA